MYILYKYTLRHTFANLHELQLNFRTKSASFREEHDKLFGLLFFGSIKCSTVVNFIISHWIL